MPKNNEIEDVEIKEEINKLQNKLKKWTEEAKKIQALFDFTVPDYIIDEIIEHKGKTNNNLYYVINCAVLNGKLSCENAKKIKAVY